MNKLEKCDVNTVGNQRRMEAAHWLTHITGDRFSRLGAEFFWIAVGQAAAVVGALLGVRLLTEMLAPAAYGELALGMTLSTLVNQTVLGPLGNGITRFYAPAVEYGDLGGYLSAVRRLMLTATGVIVLITLGTVAGLVITGRTAWIGIGTAAFALSILSGYSSILNGIQNAARNRSFVAIHQGLEISARFLVAAGLMLWLGANSTVAMIGYAGTLIPVLVSQYIFFGKTFCESSTVVATKRRWEEQILGYSWPFASWGIFTWAQQVSDRWALEFFATTNEVGLYAVLVQLGHYPMSIAMGMATQFLAPIFYQRAGDATDSRRNANVNRLTWRLTGLLLAVTTTAFLVTSLFHRQIFRVFVAAEYMTASFLLPWVILAGGVFAVGQTITLNLLSQMKTQTMIGAKIITALLGITFNLLGAYWYGTWGLVMAGLMFSLLYCVWIVMLQARSAECNS